MTDRPADESPKADRRRFLRQLSGDAVATAGRLAGMSALVRRSAVAAGEAAARELRQNSGPADSADDEPADSEPAEPAGHEPAEPEPPAPRPPTPSLTDEQHAFLHQARSAVLAVNDPAGPPQVTSGPFDWDGEVVRLTGQLFSAKATNIDRDSRVNILIENAATGGWVAIAGTATVVAGERAFEEGLRLLAKYHPAADPAAAWAELDTAGDRCTIVVRPTRFLWRIG